MQVASGVIVAVAAVAGCGRIGFEPASGVPDAKPPTTSSDGGIAMSDGAAPIIACADMNLGSQLGVVAAGSTVGVGNDMSACSGDGNDLAFGWFAPATGMYRIDTCGSNRGLDTTLYVRNGDCAGMQLACNDDACGGTATLQSRVTVSLTAGQGVVIVVDELFPTNGGNYELAITAL